MENLTDKKATDNENQALLGGGALSQPGVSQQSKVPLLQQMAASGLIAISYMAGTIDALESSRLKKMVYRATRGKALTYF